MSDLTCADDNADPGYDAGGNTILVADAPGSYTLTAELTELTATDPNLTNNTASLTVTVAQASPNPVIRGFAISPRKPKAGAPVKASFAVADSGTGQTVTPSAVRCTAAAAGVNVRGRGSVVVGRATCTFHPAKAAAGSTMRGRISATAEGKRLTKSFAVRLR